MAFQAIHTGLMRVRRHHQHTLPEGAHLNSSPEHLEGSKYYVKAMIS